VESSDFFSDQEKQQLLHDLRDWWNQADHWYHFNSGWDLAFKVGLLVLALLSVVAATTIAIRYKDRPAPSGLSIFNASVAALVTAISAFAFTTINFAARAVTYETKRNEYGAIIDELTYFRPKKSEIFNKLHTIHSWSDNNPAPAGGLPKTPPKTSGTPGPMPAPTSPALSPSPTPSG
jgi:hypothetical protein